MEATSGLNLEMFGYFINWITKNEVFENKSIDEKNIADIDKLVRFFFESKESQELANAMSTMYAIESAYNYFTTDLTSCKADMSALLYKLESTPSYEKQFVVKKIKDLSTTITTVSKEIADIETEMNEATIKLKNAEIKMKELAVQQIKELSLFV